MPDRDGSLSDNFPPLISSAFASVVKAAGLEKIEIAARYHINKATVSRWCNNLDPPLGVIADFERWIGKPPGYVMRVAGYIKDGTEKSLLETIKTTDELEDGIIRNLLYAQANTAKQMTDEIREESRREQVLARRQRRLKQ